MFKKKTDRKEIEYMLAAAGIIVSVLVAAFQINSSYQWNKRYYTAQLLKDWNNDVEKYKHIIYQRYPELADGLSGSEMGMDAMTANTLDQSYAKYYQACTGPNSNSELCKSLKSDQELRDAAVGLLNYLEYIAVSYEQDTVIQETTKETFQGNLLHWFPALGEYVKASNPKELIYWEPLIRVSCNWSKDQPSNKDSQVRIKQLCDDLLAKRS